MAKLKRYVDEMKEHGSSELEIIDRGIVNFQDVPGICEFLAEVGSTNLCESSLASRTAPHFWAASFISVV